MAHTVQQFERVLSSEFRPLLDAANEVDATDVSALSRLRRQWPSGPVEAALELVEARRKALRKFPERPDLVADRAGVEQATSGRVANYKAIRFAGLGDRLIADLCCGIGGDAMALAPTHEVLGVDRDPLRAWMCAQNAHCATRVGDVESIIDDLPGDAAFHLDPARRVEAPGTGVRRRAHRFEDYQPGPAFLVECLSRYPDGAVKLGPGIDLDALPRLDRAELEFIAEGPSLVQCVLWCGELAIDPGQHRATVLDRSTGAPLTMVAAPDEPLPAGDGQPDAYLWVPNSALERARLVGAVAGPLGLRELTPSLGLLTGNDPAESDWLDRYEVLASVPWRPKQLRAALRQHDAGRVTVKVRGGGIDANRVARELSRDGGQPVVLFGHRIGQKRVGVLTRRSSTD